MSQELFIRLNAGWPVLLTAGVLLGFVTLWAKQQARNLAWFLPVLLVAAIAFVLVAGGKVSTPLLAAETLGIGIVAVLPAIAIAFAVSCLVLFVRAPSWLVVRPRWRA